MARRILALDLGSHALKAAVIESTLRGCQIIGLWQQQRDHSRSLAEQLQEFRTAYDLRADTILSCLPGDMVTHRMLFLPFAYTRQLSQAVPFELESQIPFSLEEVMVADHVVHRAEGGATVLAVAVPKTTLSEHIEALTAAGFDPARVNISPLASLPVLQIAGVECHGVTVLLDVGENRTSIMLLQDGVLRGLRTLSIGLSRTGGFASFLQELRWSLLVLGNDEPIKLSRLFLCGGGACFPQLTSALEKALAIEVVPFQSFALPAIAETQREEQALFSVCLGMGLREALGVAAPEVNLRCGEFVPQGQSKTVRREWHRLGWLAAGVAATAGLAFALEMNRLNSRYQSLRQEIRRVFVAALPEVQTVVNEKVQLEEAIATLQSRQRLLRGTGTTSVLDVLRQLSAALPEQVLLDLDGWTFDEEAVRFHGTTTSFEAVETIKTTMAGLGLFREVQLQDVKTIAGGKKVSFGLSLLFKHDGQQGEKPTLASKSELLG